METIIEGDSMQATVALILVHAMETIIETPCKLPCCIDSLCMYESGYGDYYRR